MKSVDEPESPAFSPDGRTVVFSALRGGVGDIYTVNLRDEGLVNLRSTSSATTPRCMRRTARSSSTTRASAGTTKLFRLDLDTKKKTQITFGTHDDSGVQFMDAHTVVFSSTATDPATPLDADTARKRAHLQHLDARLTTNELRQSPIRSAATHRRSC